MRFLKIVLFLLLPLATYSLTCPDAGQITISKDGQVNPPEGWIVSESTITDSTPINFNGATFYGQFCGGAPGLPPCRQCPYTLKSTEYTSSPLYCYYIVGTDYLKQVRLQSKRVLSNVDLKIPCPWSPNPVAMGMVCNGDNYQCSILETQLVK